MCLIASSLFSVSLRLPPTLLLSNLFIFHCHPFPRRLVVSHSLVMSNSFLMLLFLFVFSFLISRLVIISFSNCFLLISHHLFMFPSLVISPFHISHIAFRTSLASFLSISLSTVLYLLLSHSYSIISPCHVPLLLHLHSLSSSLVR